MINVLAVHAQFIVRVKASGAQQFRVVVGKISLPPVISQGKYNEWRHSMTIYFIFMHCLHKPFISSFST